MFHHLLLLHHLTDRSSVHNSTCTVYLRKTTEARRLVDSGFLTGQNQTCWNTLPPTLTSYENALKLTSAQSSTFYNYKHELTRRNIYIYLIYSINRPGRLSNFWTLRVGAYSRWALIRGWALIKFSPFSASEVCSFCNKTINANNKTRRSNKARFL